MAGKWPKWFQQAIGEGLQRMRAVGLEGAPPVETIELTAEVWADAIWGCPTAWDEALDRERLRMAFKEATRKCDKWPAPKQVLALMPKRASQLMLSEPKLTEEQRKANLLKIRQTIRNAIH